MYEYTLFLSMPRLLGSEANAALAFDALERPRRELRARVRDGHDSRTIGMPVVAMAAALPNQTKAGGLEKQNDVPAPHGGIE